MGQILNGALNRLLSRRGNSSAERDHGSLKSRTNIGGLWINIVCYEDPQAWILGKIARRLAEHLKATGVSVDISRVANPRADINHHVSYWNYDGQVSSGDTLMVTHIDTDEELRKLKHQLVGAEMGICMSSPEVSRLADLGVPREKLCYVNPGHDAAIAPRKTVVGITTRLYPDGRKRESMLRDLADRVSLDTFHFKIMGGGWTELVAALRDRGIQVDYWDDFVPQTYEALFASLDYYLYTGLDEGSMGFVDAVAAGVRTIVPPQGFHLDATDGITHAFTNIDELTAIFTALAGERSRRVQAVSGWTFAENAHRHLRIWEFVHGRTTGKLVSPELGRELTAMSVVW